MFEFKCTSVVRYSGFDFGREGIQGRGGGFGPNSNLEPESSRDIYRSYP